MNDAQFRHRTYAFENRLVLDALDALRAKAGVEGRLIDFEPSASGPLTADASIELIFDDTTSHYFVECKSLLDRKTQIDQVRRRLASYASPSVLIAPYVTRELAEHCRATGVQFIDTHGNAYLRGPGFLVLVTGQRSDSKHQAHRPPKGLTNAAGLRVVFALLSKPELVTAAFKEIASQSGVSLGTAYNAIEDLERRGYLINRGNAERRKLLEWRRLLEEWAINYPTTLRTKLGGQSFSAPDPYWWKDAKLDEFHFAWGAEVAAAKMTNYLKPSTQTLFVQPTEKERLIRTLVKRHRVKPDPHGQIEILEKFWHWQPDAMPDVAPPLLVYSELLAMLDPRTQEVADTIKERFIEPAFDPE